MATLTTQIERIKSKLAIVKEIDKDLKVLGAYAHQYEVLDGATPEDVSEFEQQHGVQLPDAYSLFIMQISNGGHGEENSAPGPFYGIYTLGDGMYMYNQAENFLKNDCVIYPRMTDDYWNSLTRNIINNPDISSEDREKEWGNVFGGILPLGSQGSDFYHGLILNGKYKGRVVNVDMSLHKPQFTHEKNFLDWYERWLDEIISGELMKDGPIWFGYAMGGTDEEMITTFLNSDDDLEKADCLNGILGKEEVGTKTLMTIEEQVSKNNETIKTQLIHILCKYDYEKSKPYLIEISKTDLLSFLQFVYWYARDKSNEWLTLLEEHKDRADETEPTFAYWIGLLKETGSDYSHLVSAFTTSEDPLIQKQAVDALQLLKKN